MEFHQILDEQYPCRIAFWILVLRHQCKYTIRESWQKVIGGIAYLSQETALKLVNNSWTEFTRLNITQDPIKSPIEFISQYKMVKKQKF